MRNDFGLGRPRCLIFPENSGPHFPFFLHTYIYKSSNPILFIQTLVVSGFLLSSISIPINNQRRRRTKKMRNPGAGGSRTPSKTTPCCSKVGIKRGPWTAEEDEILSGYIQREGEGAWRTLPKRAGLLRCGKSCRLRWMNYLRPHLNRGPITPDEEDLILRLHRLLGNRWSLIAGRIPGRTDNEIKNYWNTHLSKKLISQGLDPRTHKPLEIYNPNPNNSNNSHEEVINDDARSRTPAQDSMAAMPNPNNPILPTTTTTTTTTRISLPVMLNEEDALMTSGYNEDMYFSSFLDSLIMSDDCVFQDHSMAMMQPMGGNGSDHEVSPLMASAFSESRNLDPRIDQKIGSGHIYRVHVQSILLHFRPPNLPTQSDEVLV